MTDRELRKLRRSELLEMLIESERKNEVLAEEIEELRLLVKTREIKIKEAGSIAEASLRLSGVFEAAQEAAAQYLDNIKKRAEEQEQRCEVKGEEDHE